MLPMPAMARVSSRKLFTGLRRPRVARKRSSPVSDSSSGSGPSPRSRGCRSSRAVCSALTMPKRRGSAKRSWRPLSRSSTTCWCSASGRCASATHSRPLIPRWISSVRPASVSMSRYLLRRRRPVTSAPRSLRMDATCTGSRSRRSRTWTSRNRRPSSSGTSPRRVVSTSGSSGIVCLPARPAGYAPATWCMCTSCCGNGMEQPAPSSSSLSLRVRSLRSSQ